MGELDQQKLMISTAFVLVKIPFPNTDIPLRCRARSLPTWRRLCHFDKMMNVSFSDATKLKDLVKVSIWIFFDKRKVKKLL